MGKVDVFPILKQIDSISQELLTSTGNLFSGMSMLDFHEKLNHKTYELEDKSGDVVPGDVVEEDIEASWKKTCSFWPVIVLFSKKVMARQACDDVPPLLKNSDLKSEK